MRSPRRASSFTAILVALIITLFTAQAAAKTPNFAVAPQVGVVAPQAFSDFDAAPSFGVDVGAILPFELGPFHHPLQLGMELAYTAPTISGTGDDPMLGDDGDEFQWHLRQRMLSLQLTILWRLLRPGDSFGVHLVLGPRIYLMESVLDVAADHGGDFGEYRETNTEYGVAAGLGGELRLGPGSLTIAATISRSPLDQRITGPTNTGAIHLQGGYRFFF